VEAGFRIGQAPTMAKATQRGQSRDARFYALSSLEGAIVAPA
jgi:hypothetical protein